jgi:hypothetical protein
VGAERELDLEAVEFYIRTAMLGAGARVLEQLLDGVGAGRRAQPMLCDGGRTHLPTRMASLGRREKTLTTILGPVRWRRSAYRCPVCGAVEYPGDAALGVAGTGFSPGARRMLARAGAHESFAQAAADLRLYAELEVDAKDVERTAEATGRMVADWMARQATQARLAPPADAPPTLYVSFDGTGIPLRKRELAGVPGKGADGRARTREVKLGCVFTQTTRDEAGRPVRDEAATSYTGAIENRVEFGHRIHAEALRRGLAHAGQTVVIADGAAYNKSIVAEHFPDATVILDLYHAREHLAAFVRDVARAPLDGPLHQRLRERLDGGRIEQLLDELERLLPRSGPRRKQGRTEIAYLRANAEAMRYDQFRARGLFVGSGVIEAGCRTLVGQRLKHSGMFWSTAGANAILALRCCLASGRFEQFWEDSA